MTTATKKVLATYEGYQLVQYVPGGESRVEHAGSSTCSPWLVSDHEELIKGSPSIMAYWACDDDLDDAGTPD